MKKLSIIFNVLLLLFMLTAMRGKNAVLETLNSDYVKIDKEGKLYMSPTEVSNLQYRLFLKEISTKSDASAIAAQPNLSAWSSVLNAKPYEEHYFTHPAYDAYPMVCISRQAAELYCQWLSEAHNAQSKEKRIYRLPTEAEWMQAARGGDASAIYPWKGNSLTHETKGKWDGEKMANYKIESKQYSKVANNDKADVTAPVKSYLPNAYGLYNMAGNVAEMVAEKGYVKGGHWNGKADLLRIDARGGFAGDVIPSPTVGFRPVYEVVK